VRRRHVRSGGVADAAGRELHRVAQRDRRDAGRDRLHEHLQRPRRARAARAARAHRRARRRHRDHDPGRLPGRPSTTAPSPSTPSSSRSRWTR
jgi:hypothetical protein